MGVNGNMSKRYITPQEAATFSPNQFAKVYRWAMDVSMKQKTGGEKSIMVTGVKHGVMNQKTIGPAMNQFASIVRAFFKGDEKKAGSFVFRVMALNKILPSIVQFGSPSGIPDAAFYAAAVTPMRPNGEFEPEKFINEFKKIQSLDI